MKFYLLTAILFTSIFLSCSSSKKVAEPADTASHIFDVSSFNENNKIIVDGDVSEWNSNIAFKDNHSTLTSIITADSSNLYIALIVHDDWLQMKILKMGMQIYFDTSDNELMRHYISYPVMQQTNDDENTTPANHTITKQNLITNAIIMQTNGLLATADGMHQKYNADGLKAALGKDVAGNLVYEAAIPLKEIYGNNISQNIKKNTEFNVGFLINAFPKTDYSQKNNSVSTPINGSSAFGNAQPHSHGSKTGVSPYNPGDMTSETKLWVKVKL